MINDRYMKANTEIVKGGGLSDYEKPLWMDFGKFSREILLHACIVRGPSFTNFIWILAVFFLAISNADAQRVYHSQYMFNGMAINPAFAGSFENISLTGLTRFQWVGVEGAPQTSTFSAHSPLHNANVGVGLQFVRDEIGLLTENSISINYAYRIKMKRSTLSMGILANLSYFGLRLTDAITNNPNDPSLSENVNERRFNIGTGLLYMAPDFYVGLSAPRLAQDVIETETTSVTLSPDYFLVGGILLTASPGFKVKPNFLIHLKNGEPIGYNLNLNALLKNKVWVGVSVRPPESINGLFEIQVNKKLRLGYSVDIITDGDLRRASTLSYELMINYRMPMPKTRRVVCPAYF